MTVYESTSQNKQQNTKHHHPFSLIQEQIMNLHIFTTHGTPMDFTMDFPAKLQHLSSLVRHLAPAPHAGLELVLEGDALETSGSGAPWSLVGEKHQGGKRSKEWVEILSK